MSAIQVETSYDSNELNILMTIPQGSDPATVLAITKKVLEKYIQGTKSCPNCNKFGSISKDFGWRNCSGTIRTQSWCASCRGLSREGAARVKVG